MCCKSAKRRGCRRGREGGGGLETIAPPRVAVVLGIRVLPGLALSTEGEERQGFQAPLQRLLQRLSTEGG